MIFDFNPDIILSSIVASMEASEIQLSEIQVGHILQQIDASMPGIIELMTYEAENIWKDEAINAGGWGTKYAKAIKSYFEGAEGKVYLDESEKDPGSGKPSIMFAMMMERGVKSWSIKAALLASDKAHTGPDGVRYITIPFPVATPKKSGSGNLGSRFGGREMSSDVHDIVKAGGKVAGGTSVTVKGKQVDIGGLTAFTTRQYHTGYGIFRRVSSNSTGWQYPDVPAEPVFASALRYLDKRMTEIMRTFCESVVKENSQS
jgi:hypothetical protein